MLQWLRSVQRILSNQRQPNAMTPIEIGWSSAPNLTCYPTLVTPHTSSISVKPTARRFHLVPAELGSLHSSA
jgi:hypothetical protein